MAIYQKADKRVSGGALLERIGAVQAQRLAARLGRIGETRNRGHLILMRHEATGAAIGPLARRALAA